MGGKHQPHVTARAVIFQMPPQRGCCNLLIGTHAAGKVKKGRQGFPGGKVEPGEEPHITVVREVDEEVHLDIIVLNLQPVKRQLADNPAITLLYYACLAKPTAVPTGSDEMADPRFIGVADIARPDLTGNMLPDDMAAIQAILPLAMEAMEALAKAA